MNSSIFNFEPLRVAGGTVWGRKLFILPLFCLYAAILTASTWGVGTLRSQDRSAPYREYSAPSDKVEILLLGNSQFLGLDPRKISLPTANYAMAGSDFSVQNAILKSLSPDMPNLKFLFLGFGNVTWLTPAMENRKGDLDDLFDWGVHWNHLPGLSPYQQLIAGIAYHPFLRPLFVGPKPDFEWLNKRFAGLAAHAAPEFPPAPADFDPMKVQPGFSAAPGQGASKVKYYIRDLKNRNNQEGNTAALFAMFEHCKRRGVRVFLLRAPTTHEFHGNRSEEWNLQLEELADRARKEYPETLVEIWDDETAGIFPTHLFKDPNHLNPTGFDLYTEILNDRLKQHLPSETQN